MKLISPELKRSGKDSWHVTLWWPWLVFFAIAGATTILFTVFSTYNAYYSTFYCDSDNTFRYKYSGNGFDHRLRIWDSNTTLTVTMGWKGLTFVQAKVIDICFDLVVGRGLQILVALASYPLLRRAVLRSMEVREFSLALLLPFFMERLSIYTLWAMVSNMRTVRPKKPESGEQVTRPRTMFDWRIVLVFLIGCYVLAMPTVLSAMTSYQARGYPYVATEGDGYMTVANLTIPDIVIMDGERVGLLPRFPLYNTSDTQLFTACIGYYGALAKVDDLWDENWGPYRHSTARTEGEFLAEEMAFNTTRDSLPMQQNITDSQIPPMWSFTLWPRNATWSRISRYRRVESYMNSTIMIQNTTYNLGEPLSIEPNDLGGVQSASTIYAYGNNTATGAGIASMGKCLPSNDYVWGFSSLILFSFSMLTLAVLLLLVVLHYDAHCNSMADRYKLQISPYRDVLDLADELRSRYGDAEAAGMSAKALDQAMQKDPTTAGLETATLHTTRAARWKQSGGMRRLPTWKSVRTNLQEADCSKADAEEALMSIGADGKGGAVEMGKMPARVVTRRVS